MSSQMPHISRIEDLVVEKPKPRKCLGPSCDKIIKTIKATRLCTECKLKVTDLSNSFYHLGEHTIVAWD